MLQFGEFKIRNQFFKYLEVSSIAGQLLPDNLQIITGPYSADRSIHPHLATFKMSCPLTYSMPELP
jgi:hypothetical protein